MKYIQLSWECKLSVLRRAYFAEILIDLIAGCAIRKVLESYGYEMNAPRSGSSHYTFRKQGCMPITIPKHEPIKKIYVEMVRKIVESEAKNDEDAE